MTKHRFELSLAKSIMSMFARSYRPYAFGAFGKPTMQYICSALAANRVVCAFDADGTLAGAALFSITRADSIHQDFSHRECWISRGSLYARHLAVTSGDAAKVIGSLAEKLCCRANGAPVWLEIHEENRSMRREIGGRLGFTYVMTKIMASSDIRGLYLKGPATVKLAPLPRSDVPALKCLQSGFLSLKEMTDILKELNKYASRRQVWAQHYSHYNKRKSWTAFSLRGYCASDASFVAKPTEMSKQWKLENPKLLASVCGNTVAAKHFPMTLRVVRRIPGAKERVRFMRLEPAGGELGRHADITDREAGTQDGGVVRLHIPLVTHQDVLFEGWDLRGEHQEMHFGARGLYYLDQRKPHRVINRSPVERIHLVVDTYSSRSLRDLMR